MQSPDFEKTSRSRDLQVFSKLVESAFSVSRNRFCSVPGENSTYGRRFIPGKDTEKSFGGCPWRKKSPITTGNDGIKLKEAK